MKKFLVATSLIIGMIAGVMMLSSFNATDNVQTLNKKNVISQYQAQTISAKYSYEEDFKRYGQDVWMFNFTSDGRIIKCLYIRDNYRRIRDWNPSYEYGTYEITESTSRNTYISIRWANGRTEKCYITYDNKYYSHLHYNMQCYREIN